MRRPASNLVTRLTGAGILTVSFALAGFSQGADPKITPGQDPGGVAVAIITSGIDYTEAIIAKHVARDGEGEMIAYDFVDNDARPYQKAEASAESSEGTALARSVADIAGTRLVAARVAAQDPVSIARGAAFVAQTPARVVLLPFSGGDAAQWEAFKQVATRAKRVLFLVPAGEEAARAFPADLGLDNVLPVGGETVTRGLAVELGKDASASKPAAVRAALVTALDQLLGCKGELPAAAADGAQLKTALLAKTEPANESRKVPLLKRCPDR